MADRNEEEGIGQLVAIVFDELERNPVVRRSSEEFPAVEALTDSCRRPRLSSIERGRMLSQLPVD